MPVVEVRRAAALAIGAMVLIGLIDNLIVMLADLATVWQFHALRSTVILLMLLGLAALGRAHLWPRRPGIVALRSLAMALSMILYFGSLGVLPIAQVTAGLFTAPIFVLLISILVLGERIGPIRLLAVGIGFVGILIIVQPWQAGVSPLVALPVIGGLFYAITNCLTGTLCREEATTTLLAWFFGVIGLVGAVGSVLLPVLMPTGVGYLMGPPQPLSGPLIAIVLIQAVGSLIGVGLLTRAYQIAPTSRVSVFDYALLPSAAGFAWILWGQVPTVATVIGTGFIVFAGLLIIRRGSGLEGEGGDAPSLG